MSAQRVPSEEEISVTIEASGEFKFTWNGYADDVTDALYRAMDAWNDDDPAIDDELPGGDT